MLSKVFLVVWVGLGLSYCAGNPKQIVPGFLSENKPSSEEKQEFVSIEQEKRFSNYFSFANSAGVLACPDNSVAFSFHPVKKKIICHGGYLNTIKSSQRDAGKYTIGICDQSNAVTSLNLKNKRISNQKKCRLILHAPNDFEFYTINERDSHGYWSCHQGGVLIGFDLNRSKEITSWHCLAFKEKKSGRATIKKHLHKNSFSDLDNLLIERNKIELKAKYFSFGLDYLLMIENEQVAFIRSMKAVDGLYFEVVDRFGRVVLRASQNDKNDGLIFSNPMRERSSKDSFYKIKLDKGEGVFETIKNKKQARLIVLEKEWYKTIGVFNSKKIEIARFNKKFHLFRNTFLLEFKKSNASLSPLKIIVSAVYTDYLQRNKYLKREPLGRQKLIRE